MSYRITSDGTPGGTHVYDDAGEPIEHVQKIVWEMEVGQRTAKITIVVRPPGDALLEGEAG